MGHLNLANYRSIVFDCDGVILNSNKIKTDAFAASAAPYGETFASELVEYHKLNGGISRYRKFEYFLSDIAGVEVTESRLDALLTSYAQELASALAHCEVAEGLRELRKMTPHSRWHVASGGDQMELRQLFLAKDLSGLYDGGIFGSPDTKDEILARELASGNIRRDALFLGDSRYDHTAAANAGLDFAFLSEWSEFEDWPDYVQSNNLFVAKNLASFLK